MPTTGYWCLGQDRRWTHLGRRIPFELRTRPIEFERVFILAAILKDGPLVKVLQEISADSSSAAVRKGAEAFLVTKFSDAVVMEKTHRLIDGNKIKGDLYVARVRLKRKPKTIDKK